MRVPTKQDILERLLKEAKELYPNNIWIPGLPHTDFAITIPLAEGYRNFLLSLYTLFMTTIQGINYLVNSDEFLQLLKTELGLSDEELNLMLEQDIKARTYPLTPSDGAPAYGTVRVFIRNQNYIVLDNPEDIFFIDSKGNRFKPLIYGRLEGYNDSDTGQTYVNIPVVSIEKGSDKNIDIGSILSFETNNTSLLNVISGVTNTTSFKYGRDPETLKDFVSRLIKWHSIQRGVDYLPYIENLMYSLGVEQVMIRRTGDKYYNRGYGIDVWIRAPEVYVDLTYNGSLDINPVLQPIIKVNGAYLVSETEYNPEQNAYTLSIRQKQISSLNTGDIITFNPTIFYYQQAIEGLNQTWWIGGTAVLVRMGLPVPLTVEVSGKVNPETDINTISNKLDSLIRSNYTFGATVYYSDLLNWLLDIGMEYAYLDTMQVSSDLVTSESQRLQLNFYQYPILKELIIHEL